MGIVAKFLRRNATPSEKSVDDCCLNYESFSECKKQPLLVDKFVPALREAEKVNYFKKHYNFMDYHIKFFNELSSKIDFSGKAVLEIGGSNTPTDLAFDLMGAKKWVCIDKPWKSNLKSQCNHYSKIPLHKFKDIKLCDALASSDMVIFDEFADEMTLEFYGQFDICVSNCCFEHVNNLPRVLCNIFYSLNEGGVLYSKFAPIWSAPNGNHIRINDESLSFSLWHIKNYPKELWHSHLYMGYKNIYQHLASNYSDEVAVKYSHLLKNGIGLNKLMYEDYLFIMQQSLFSNKSVVPTYTHDIDEMIMTKLRGLYRGYYRFDVAGVTIQARK